MKMIKITSLFLLIVSISCDNTVSKINSNPTIEIMLSGYGRSIPIEENETLIPKNELFEVYSLKLNHDGELTTYRGFGELTENSVSLNKIIDTASVQLTRNTADSIKQMAQKLYNEKEYLTDNSPTDSWLIDLKIDNKHFIYHRGDGLASIDPDFIKIVDLIVDNSALKVERYP